MEGGKDNKNLPTRTEFSDFVVRSAKQYFDRLALPQEQKDRMARLLVVPFGSVARGNASELTSDLDLILVEDNPNTYEMDILPLTDGSYDENHTSLGEFIFGQYEVAHPGYRDKREVTLGQEFTGEIEIDNPHPLIDDLLDSIEQGTTNDYELSPSRQTGGHSDAVLLGLILNIDPDLIIAGNKELLDEIRNKIKNKLVNNPAEVESIKQEYEDFLAFRKSEAAVERH